MIMQFKNKLACFIVTTEKRNPPQKNMFLSAIINADTDSLESA